MVQVALDLQERDFVALLSEVLVKFREAASCEKGQLFFGSAQGNQTQVSVALARPGVQPVCIEAFVMFLDNFDELVPVTLVLAE